MITSNSSSRTVLANHDLATPCSNWSALTWTFFSASSRQSSYGPGDSLFIGLSPLQSAKAARWERFRLGFIPSSAIQTTGDRDFALPNGVFLPFTPPANLPYRSIYGASSRHVPEIMARKTSHDFQYHLHPVDDPPYPNFSLGRNLTRQLRGARHYPTASVSSVGDHPFPSQRRRLCPHCLLSRVRLFYNCLNRLSMPDDFSPALFVRARSLTAVQL